jgi:hypothetical protein
MEIDPDEVQAYINRGNAWVAKNEAIRLDPTYAWAYNNRCLVVCRTSDFG